MTMTDVRRIVVGVDGSPSSTNALRWADRLASAIDARIEAVFAWEYPPTWPDDGNWQPDVAASKRLQEAIDEVFGAHRPKGLEAETRRGDARDVLLDAARDAEMLVVGSRGHGGFYGLLLGSVSAACAEHARCPVLVVHGNESDE